MEPDDYQEQQDSLNINEQTWRDGSSGGLGGDDSTRKNEGTSLGSMDVVDKKEKSPFSIKDYEQQLALWSTPEFKKGYQALLDEMNGKQPLKEAALPTAEELSERFGGSFAPILERFKEQIRFEITMPSATLGIPEKLDNLSLNLSSLFLRAADSVNLQLKDSEKDPSKKVDLEFMRVDIRILNVTADNTYKESEVPSPVLDLKISDEETYPAIRENMQRGLDEKGVVGNPGHDGEWITLNVYDPINERELDIKFIVYLQVRKR